MTLPDPTELRAIADFFGEGPGTATLDPAWDWAPEVGRDSDAAAARHQSILGFSIPPFAGVFLDGEGRVGGQPGELLSRVWLSEGLDPRDAGLSVEHVEGLARLLAVLLERGSSPALGMVLSNQVDSWIPSLVHALERAGADDYAAAADRLVDLSRALGDSSSPETPEEPLPRLTDEMGLRSIAGILAVHARSGFFVGRSTVAGIARTVGAPRGFGGTALMLRNLLESASHYDLLGDVLRAFNDEAASYDRMWQDVSAAHPGLRHWAGYWRQRMAASRAILHEVGQATAD